MMDPRDPDMDIFSVILVVLAAGLFLLAGAYLASDSPIRSVSGTIPHTQD